MKQSPKAQLLKIIKKHCRGRDRGGSIGWLQCMMEIGGIEIGDRECRALIAELVADGALIGTSPQHGVFWIVTLDDYKASRQSARAAFTTIRRHGKLRKNCIAAGVFKAKGRRS